MISKFRTEEMCSLERLTFTNPPEVENNPGGNEAGILPVVQLVAAKFTLFPTVISQKG